MRQQLQYTTILIHNKMKSKQKPKISKTEGAVENQDKRAHVKKENVGVIVGTKYKGIGIGNIIQKQAISDRKITQSQIDKFENVLSSQTKGRLSRLQQGREGSLKVYQKNNFWSPKQLDRLTFSPEKFKNSNHSYNNLAQNELNPELIIPTTHKYQGKSRSSVKLNTVNEINSKSKAYQIMSKQLGMSNSAILKLKEQALNYELQKFLKKKGIEYLAQIKETNNRRRTEEPINQLPNLEIVLINSRSKKNAKSEKKKLQKYPNYIPEVFPKIERKSCQKKTVLSVKPYKIKEEKSKNKKMAKMDVLNEQEQMLGKIVFDKVEEYFGLEKAKGNYFSRVKSEERIDEAWIKYLKTKIEKADLILN